MTWGLVVAGVAGVAGAAISANGAKKAAGTQAQSASDATAAQERMFERQVELQQPWMDTGKQGLNMLSQYLGINNGQPSPGGVTGASLVDTSGGAPTYNRQLYESNQAYRQAWDSVSDRHFQWAGKGYTNQADPGWIENEVRTLLAPQYQAEAAAAQAKPPDPKFGSLLKPFGASDFQADPGYAFRQAEQEKALQRAASSHTGINSGKYLKDAMSYSGGLASQEYGKAFDRFNVGQTNIFNRLASIAGVGQTAANQTGAAAQNFGSQIGGNIIGAGNALAAGQVGRANALNNGLSQGASMYQQNQMMNRMFPQGGYDTGAGMSPPNPYYQG